MFDHPDSPPVEFRSLLSLGASSGRKRLRFGGGRGAVRVLSGCFHFDVQPRNPLLELLPPVVHVRSRGTPVPWLAATLQFLEAEENSQLLGSAAVMTRLGDILFVQLLRAHLGQQDAEHAGWLRAINDPQLSRALQKMHQKPEAPWSVESLVRIAGMGRSQFADRFREAIGASPILYLKGWRLQKAAELLRSTRMPIKEIASQAGYDCEISFGKAVRKWSGAPPAQYRRKVSVQAPTLSQQSVA